MSTAVSTTRTPPKARGTAPADPPRSHHRRGWLVRRALVAADVSGLVIAYVVSQAIFGNTHYSHLSGTYETLLFISTLPLWVLIARLQGLYRHDEERTDHTTADDLVGVFYLTTIGSWIVFVVTKLSGVADPRLDRVTLFWGLAIVLVTLSRGAARVVCRRHPSFGQNAVIVGAGLVGLTVARKLAHHPEYGVRVVGFVDADPLSAPEDDGYPGILGVPDDMPEIIDRYGIERVIMAFSTEPAHDTVELIRRLSDIDVQIDIVPRFFDVLGPGLDIHTVEGLPMIGLAPFRLSRSSRLLKRAMDLAVSTFSLVLLSPVFTVIAVLIKLDSRGPVFFRQERMGADDATFRIYKFRTMRADADERKLEVAHLNQHLDDDPRMFKIPDDPRVTRFGRFLRHTSLDELAQLFNVLRGEMSLVGPRPLILDEDRYVYDWARKRLDLKPGMRMSRPSWNLVTAVPV